MKYIKPKEQLFSHFVTLYVKNKCMLENLNNYGSFLFG